MNRWIKRTMILLAVITVAVLAIIADVQLKYANRVLSLSTSPWPNTSDHGTAIILGAGIRPDGQPSDALRDRMDTALHMQELHLTDTLFVTGDNGAFHNNEIGVMEPYLIQHGAPTSSLIIDPTGYRTYESCKHAAANGIKNAIVVTQRFHLGRAMYLCNQLGLNAYGMDADLHPYGMRLYYFWLRDLLSSVKAWWDINIHAPAPPVESTSTMATEPLK